MVDRRDFVDRADEPAHPVRRVRLRRPYGRPVELADPARRQHRRAVVPTAVELRDQVVGHVLGTGDEEARRNEAAVVRFVGRSWSAEPVVTTRREALWL